MGTLIVGGILVVAVVCIVRYQWNNRKRGGCSACPGGCGHCDGGCH